ncbi:MAG: 1-acyl-sn-glycerol-3-phosphate acyltransferase [Firmicutes bacterium]|nr:1-acyl-sn-glycerol-3-phosphate acyltransferase [Bacillota bacterium]
MNDIKRHKLSYRVIRKLAMPIFKTMFNYQFPIVDQVKEPYIVLANHNLELDPALVALAFPQQMYFVASEHILRKGFGGWFLMHFLKPIIRMKGKVEVKTVAEILRTARAGHNVCIFAEGARSFNGRTCSILPSTGKMVKRSGSALITYRMEGGYFSQPRWSLSLRKGRIQGVVAGIYSSEELKAMSEDQVNALIVRDLHEDAYATQAKDPVPYKGKKLALGMESTLFLCPKCGQTDTMQSNDTSITCSCGTRFTYTEYGDLLSPEGEKRSITEWDLWQQEQLRLRYESAVAASSEEAFFSDEVTLFAIDENHEIQNTQKGTLTAYSDRIECCGRSFFYEEMLGLDIFSRNFIVMNYGKDAAHYEMKGDLMFCALKYLYLYKLVKGEPL